MNSNTAHRVVLISAMITFGIGWFDAASQGKTTPSAKFLIGAGTAFVLISMLADIEPGVGGALALAVGTGAFLNKGQGILSYVNQGVSTPKTAAVKQPKQQTKNKPVHVAAHA